MKTFGKFFLIGVLLTLAGTPAYAQDAGFIAKIKSFFTKKPVQTEAVAESAEAASQPVDPNAPTFDFSEQSIGAPDAPLKMLVFTSLTCPHCTNMHLNLMPMLKAEYADTNRAQIIFMDFPLEPRAMAGSLVAHCLPKDEYLPFIDTLFAHQMQWAVAPDLNEALAPYAKLAGMSEAKMKACIADEKANKELMRIRNLNAMQYKIQATPTLLIRFGKKTEMLVGLPGMQDVAEAVKKLTDPNYVPPKPEHKH